MTNLISKYIPRTYNKNMVNWWILIPITNKPVTSTCSASQLTYFNIMKTLAFIYWCESKNNYRNTIPGRHSYWFKKIYWLKKAILSYISSTQQCDRCSKLKKLNSCSCNETQLTTFLFVNEYSIIYLETKYWLFV